MKPRDLITAAFGQHNIFVAKEFVFRSIGPNLGKSLSTVIGLGPLPEAASTKILFIHVPRTAGSSVSVGLYGRKVSHHTASYFRAIDPALFDRCFRFSFVRNPWDRLVSAYHLLKAGGSDVVQVWDPHKYVKLKQLDFDEFVHDWLWPRRFRMRPLMSETNNGA